MLLLWRPSNPRWGSEPASNRPAKLLRPTSCCIHMYGHTQLWILVDSGADIGVDDAKMAS
eukprot:scaffold62694_cov28-Prasinocladus_malaysianus.AAC.2